MPRAPRAYAVFLLAGLLGLGPLASGWAQDVAAGASYTSETYGAGVRWDPAVWTVDPDGTVATVDGVGLDQLTLTSDTATLTVGMESRGDATASDCVEAEAARFTDEAGVAAVTPIALDDGSELAGVEDEVAFRGLERELTDEAAADAAPMIFVECRLLADGASLWFVLESTSDSFGDDMAAAGTVNATLTLDGVELAAVPGVAVATATPAVVDPALAAEFDALVAEATAAAPVAGPLAGELTQTEGAATLEATGVDPADFLLRVRFQTPEAPTPWDFGVAFRQGAGEEYRLVIDSGGGWYLTQGVDADVQTGVLTQLVTRPGGVNALELIADGEVAWFRLNDEVVGPLNVRAIGDGGPIAIGTAFFADNTAAGTVLPYRALTVWSLSAANDSGATEARPDATPDAGNVASPAAEETTAVTLAPVGADGVMGEATLTTAGAETVVTLVLSAAAPGAVVAIHSGSCASFAPVPAYALADFDSAGESVSTVALDEAALAAGGLAVVVHAGLADYDSVVACGEVGGAR